MSAAISISYPADPVLLALELKQCENCPDLFTRAVGSAIKFCARCIADHQAHPIPWARGSLAAYVRENEEDITVKRYCRAKSKVASRECQRGIHFACAMLTCPCKCHADKNAQ